MPREPHGQETLCSVEDQRRHSNGPSRRSRNVGGANVSASTETDVAAARRPHEQIAEWNRPQEVSQDNQSPKARGACRRFRIHSGLLPANEKVASRVYSAPPGFRTL